KTKIKNAKRGLIIDSHISHLLPSKIVDLCIVLTCSHLKVLQKRLQQRKYSQSKIRENLDAEIFQICLMEAREMRHKIIIFDTSKDEIQKIISKIKNTIS
ncbi:MAG: AAA family ATPase, partial [Nanoarchaeota archaeon]|nr:AAA family ATPase [Nanoarchaeota archaeon]